MMRKGKKVRHKKDVDDERITFFAPGEKNEELQREDIAFIFKYGKTWALILAVFYLLIAAMRGGEAFFYMLAYLIIPLAFIWFSDYLGQSLSSPMNPLTGMTRLSSNAYPSVIAKVIGWIILLVPIARGIISVILISKR